MLAVLYHKSCHGRCTRDRKVAGSTPSRGAIKSSRSTQSSIPPS